MDSTPSVFRCPEAAAAFTAYAGFRRAAFGEMLLDGGGPRQAFFTVAGAGCPCRTCRKYVDFIPDTRHPHALLPLGRDRDTLPPPR